MILTYLPGLTGIKLRRFFYRRKFLSCGKNLIIHTGVIIENPSYISFGDNVTIDPFTILRGGGDFDVNIIKGKIGHGKLIIGNNIHIGSNCVIAFHAGIYIGNNCVIGSGTQIYSMSNSIIDQDPKNIDYSLMPYSKSKFICGEVTINSNCWITLNCVIMPSVKIEKNCFVGSGSIITKNLKENIQINRDKKIKKRFLTNVSSKK